MPKPVLPDGLEPEMRVGTAAREIIRAKVDEVALYVGPAMEGDFDGIHDMRVGVKRLREALRLFGRLIRKRRRKHVIAMAQELNDALGVVRERDVAVRDAGRVVQEVPDAEQLIQGLIDEWSDQREQGMVALRDLWGRLDGSDDFLAETRRAARSAHRRSAPLNEAPLDQFAYAAITARADQVMAALDQARGSDQAYLLHMLRIAVKKLKYTMEPFGPIFPELQPPYEMAAALQDSLGLTHDYDVLLAALEDYFRRAGEAESDPALKALDLVRRERADRYAEARDDVNHLDGQAWLRQLLDAID